MGIEQRICRRRNYTLPNHLTKIFQPGIRKTFPKKGL